MTGSRLTSVETRDIRFPTSRELDGSDAMNPDPDYSAAYVVLRTDAGDGLEGHGFAFTIGRGNDVQTAAIAALRPYLVGRPARADCCADLGGLWRELVHDSQLRWLGPEKGVMHMAIGAVVNAAVGPRRQAGRACRCGGCCADMSARASWSRWSTSATSPTRSPPTRRWTSCAARRAGRAERERAAARATATRPTPPRPAGSATTTTSCAACASEAVADGFTQIKLKVGADLEDDVAAAAHRPGGLRPGHPHRDRRQPALGRRPRRSTGSARWRRSTRGGSRSRPAPTTCSATPRSPGRSRPIPVATGEHVQNRVVFKQLLQAERDLLPAARRRPGRGRQREHRDPAAGGEVRRAGLPARRRGRPVRAGPAPGDVRLRGRVRARWRTG